MAACRPRIAQDRLATTTLHRWDRRTALNCRVSAMSRFGVSCSAHIVALTSESSPVPVAILAWKPSPTAQSASMQIGK